VSEYEFPKKLVVWGQADDFVTTTSFIFMEHPARPNHTIVRQVCCALVFSLLQLQAR
jgi:hypothetical protein